MSPEQLASTRLAASWLLTYPDEALLQRLDLLAAAVAELPDRGRVPLQAFLDHLSGTPLRAVQEHYVSVFDMKRKACPYLTFWTDGDTRNRGVAIVRFKQAYSRAGFQLSDAELPDHLSVVLEFAATCDEELGGALLAEHTVPIGLLRDSLVKTGSVYSHVLDAVVDSLPPVTPQTTAAMAALAASGPPTEMVGLEPFANSQDLLTIGERR